MSMDYSEAEAAKASMRDEASDGSFVEGLGQSMRALEVVIRELARSNVPVLLLAERGAGKQAAAERIHRLSKHRNGAFQAVSNADISETRLAANSARDGVVNAVTHCRLWNNRVDSIH